VLLLLVFVTHLTIFPAPSFILLLLLTLHPLFYNHPRVQILFLIALTLLVSDFTTLIWARVLVRLQAAGTISSSILELEIMPAA
jgi:hypothetical protein